MRLVAQVFLAYFMVLVVSALWRFVPIGRAIPDLVALSAVYIGLAARERVAPAMLAAVVMGYLADLVMGTPSGLLSAGAGVMCLLGHFVQGRLIVRGAVVTAVFALVVGLVSGAVLITLRAWAGVLSAPFSSEVGTALLSALLTALVGPLVFRMCRRVDARFARTRRERDAAAEGWIP
ncbi:MAG TPA: rod shape-determining protein MreD [Candidatus Acidoferrum sp.]|nr:rod shape-determining protein MreD [Candidatus Acidoferrum sp.]